MKKIKHSKIKNTGMLFELLARQITSDIISANESMAVKILRKFFSKNTELIKEYRLYNTLCNEKMKSETKANMLIEAALKAKMSIDKKKLQQEKYELIHEIRNNFDIDLFFQTKVQNYKLLASIYKLFEYKDTDNPLELTKSRITILENITKKPSKNTITEEIAILEESKEVRLLSYKLLIEKFNTKYNDLNEDQKHVLREYISNVSNTNNLKMLIQNEASTIKKILTKRISEVKDTSLKIKILEITNLLDTYNDIKTVEEHHISSLLRYYSILDDLSWS